MTRPTVHTTHRHEVYLAGQGRVALEVTVADAQPFCGNLRMFGPSNAEVASYALTAEDAAALRDMLGRGLLLSSQAARA